MASGDAVPVEDEGQVRQSAVYVGLVLAAVVGILTVLGLEGNAVQRLYRDDGRTIFAAYSFVVLAIGLELYLGLAPPGRASNRRWMLRFGLMLFVAGILTLLWAVFQSFSETGRPELEASLVQGPQGDQVLVKLHVRGLTSTDRVRLAVFGAAERTVDGNERLVKEVLHMSEFGSTDGGTVERSVPVDVPSAAFHRYFVGVEPVRVGPPNKTERGVGQKGTTAGESTAATVVANLAILKEDNKTCANFDFDGPLSACIEFASAGPSRRPIIGMTFPSGSPEVAEVTVAGARLGPRDAVVLNVVDMTDQNRVLHREVVGPDGVGSVQRQLDIRLGRSPSRLCAVAVLWVRNESPEPDPSTYCAVNAQKDHPTTDRMAILIMDRKPTGAEASMTAVSRVPLQLPG